MSGLVASAERLQAEILDAMGAIREGSSSNEGLNRAWHAMGDVLMELRDAEELEDEGVVREGTRAMYGDRVRLWLKQLVWHLNGTAGRSIVWRIRALKARYTVGVGLAERVCRGNRYGDHTADVIHPLGGECFCHRVRRRLDYIPF